MSIASGTSGRRFSFRLSQRINRAVSMGEARGSRVLLLQAHRGTRRQIPPPAGAACDRLEVAALRLALAVRGGSVWAPPEISGDRGLRAPAAGPLSSLLAGAARRAGGGFGVARP